MQTLEFRGDHVRMVAALFSVVATCNDARHYLRGVYADKEHLIGTNGHVVAYFKHNQTVTHPFIIPARKLPATTIGITFENEVAGNEIFSEYSTKKDLSVKQPTVDRIDGQFPDNWERVADIPEHDRVEGDLSRSHVSFQPALIMPILKSLKEDRVLFEQFGDKIRASIKGFPDLNVMIMSVKI